MKPSLKIALLVLAGLLIALAPAAAQQPQVVQITNGPIVEGVGGTWAVIAWTTNTGASSIVHYGTDRDPRNLNTIAESPWTKGDDPSRTTHRVHLNGLQPNTTYYFLVDSNEASGTGTQAKSNVSSFTTKSSDTPGGGQAAAPEPVRITNGPVVESVSNNSAVIAWTTNTGSNSIVHYGTDRDPRNLNTIAESPWTKGDDPSRTTHRVQLTGLQPNTTYYFLVDSGEASGTGTQAKSNVASFTTKAQ